MEEGVLLADVISEGHLGESQFLSTLLFLRFYQRRFVVRDDYVTFMGGIHTCVLISTCFHSKVISFLVRFCYMYRIHFLHPFHLSSYSPPSLGLLLSCKRSSSLFPVICLSFCPQCSSPVTILWVTATVYNTVF